VAALRAATIAIVAAAPAMLAAQDPRAGRAAYERALALEQEGNHAAALSLLWTAAGSAPRDAEIQNRLGEALERLGALDAAIDAYDQALAARPAYRRAQNNLVVALGKAGRGAEAMRRADGWLAADPGDPELRYTRALAASEQDVGASMAALRQVVAARPDHALAHYNLALLLKRVDRIDEAVAAAERAVAIDGRPEAHLLLGTLLAQRGDPDRALRSFDAATRADARFADAWIQRAMVLRGRGDLAGAAEALRRAIAIRPGSWHASAALATVLAAAGDPGAARAASAEAERLRDAERQERAAVTMTTVGIARLDGGDLAGALERFSRATAEAPAYAPAHYHLGRTLRRLGRTAEARAAFARAQQLNPSLVPPAADR
jgi:tetratricopeptide (TPR) repeat protein